MNLLHNANNNSISKNQTKAKKYFDITPVIRRKKSGFEKSYSTNRKTRKEANGKFAGKCYSFY